MVARKQNLLEAFRAAAPESRAAQKRNPTAPPAVGGPFAPPKPTAEREGTRLQFFEPQRPSLVQRMLHDRAVQLAVLLAAVAVAAAFLFKRGSTTADAAGATAGDHAAQSAPPTSWDGVSNPALIPTPTTKQGTPPTEPKSAKTPLATPPTNASEHDKAFWNLENKYTVRVAQYDNDENGLKAARAAVTYLLRDGYPAVQPIQSGDGAALIVCVGALPKAKDLDPLLKDLRLLRGPAPQPKKPPFRDAYVVGIDDVLRRQ